MGNRDQHQPMPAERRRAYGGGKASRPHPRRRDLAAGKRSQWRNQMSGTMGIEWSEEPDPQDCKRVKELVSYTGVFSQAEIDCAGELVSDTLSGREIYYFLFARQ